jgi:hypothetical protein
MVVDNYSYLLIDYNSIGISNLTVMMTRRQWECQIYISYLILNPTIKKVKPHVVVHICNPSCSGSRVRRNMAWGFIRKMYKNPSRKKYRSQTCFRFDILSNMSLHRPVILVLANNRCPWLHTETNCLYLNLWSRLSPVSILSKCLCNILNLLNQINKLYS